MSTELPKQYDPQAAQQRWFAFWEQRGDFNADPGQLGPDGQPKPSHTIMIPLPNVTGALHMGHALNGTVQDLITRWRRMQGYEALWMPGTDHAGIATQSIVEKRMLEEEGFTRHTIPTKEGQTQREALVDRIWKWKDVYEARILSQQKQLGASCDWRRVRFTLDDVCSKAVRRTFFKMFQDGLIYRGKRLVNWDPFLQTAVADDEVYDEEIDGHFWTFNYPVVADGKPTGERISFSTTRPETMLGDTAVCVHPTDERYTSLVGKQVQIPLNGRLIPIIADGLLADKELGTGCVKVTPAHDPNDYACFQRNPEIGLINILNPNGSINANGGQWEGLDRYDARKAVVAEMEKLGHFEKVEDRKIPMKHSDRSKTPIEPYLSEQWFVKMGPHTLPSGREVDLAQSAMDAVNQRRVQFFPSRYSKTYLDWLGEKRDWCISRQLWWGHRIPIWTKVVDATQQAQATFGGLSGMTESVIEFELSPEVQQYAAAKVVDGATALEKRILVCVDEGHADLEQELEAAGFIQDPDVLDTWFSSALWPHATLGWPDRDHNPPLDPKEVAKQTDRGPRDQGPSGNASPPSALDPSPLGQNEVLTTFYPGSVLVTSRDIITLWVARMVLTGLYNMADDPRVTSGAMKAEEMIPFKHVCVHPKILDGFGQGMSKSKGNGVDPLELIDRYGCDGTRFTIASFAGETQDVRLPVSYECPHCQAAIPQFQEHLKFKPGKPTVKCPKCKKESQYAQPWYTPDPGAPVARIIIERFEYGRNFCNKLWNAARFAIMNLEGYTPAEVPADQLQLEDRWILSRLTSVAKEMDEYLSRYQLDAATRAIREFTWNEFCDWYLEMIKPRLRRVEGQEQTREVAQRVLLAVLDSLVRLLQPFTPFICEELWSRLNEIAPVRALPPQGEASRSPDLGIRLFSTLDLLPRPAEPAAIVAQWPTFPTAWRDEALERRFSRLQETIIAVRNVRAVYNIPPSTQLQLMIRSSAEVAGDMQNVASQFDNLAKSVLAAAGADVVRPPASASFSLGDADGFVPLEGIIDRKSELDRQQKEADKLKKLIAGSEGKLNNESFVSKAPAHIVDGIKETLAGLQKQLANAEEIIRDLS
jgi:valyl-tRNA synthetase